MWKSYLFLHTYETKLVFIYDMHVIIESQSHRLTGITFSSQLSSMIDDRAGQFFHSSLLISSKCRIWAADKLTWLCPGASTLVANRLQMALLALPRPSTGNANIRRVYLFDEQTKLRMLICQSQTKLIWFDRKNFWLDASFFFCFRTFSLLLNAVYPRKCAMLFYDCYSLLLPQKNERNFHGGGWSYYYCFHITFPSGDRVKIDFQKKTAELWVVRNFFICY